jgi:hypothetical protein
MTGQRNENSVLFSLNNLQALASGSGPPAAGASAPKAADAARPGFANSSTEGSGLIDIRAMAASTLASSPTTTAAKPEDGPGFASPPLFAPMAAPILMPAPASGPPKWIWALLGVGVLAVLGIVVVGVLLLTRKPEVAAVNPAAVAPVVAAAPTAPTAPAPAAAAPTAPTAAAPAAAAAAAPDATKAEEGKGKHGSKGGKTAKGGKEAAPAAAAAAPAAAAPAAPAAAPKKAGKRDELDDLLNAASPDKPAPKRSAPREESGGGDSGLPDQLDKSAIVGGMKKVSGKVASCYEQFKVPGLANVTVTISKGGRVSRASVGGSFSGTPTGSCVESAVKSASFPPSKSDATITYPFMLR